MNMNPKARTCSSSSSLRRKLPRLLIKITSTFLLLLTGGHSLEISKSSFSLDIVRIHIHWCSELYKRYRILCFRQIISNTGCPRNKQAGGCCQSHSINFFQTKMTADGKRVYWQQSHNVNCAL